MPNGFGGWYGPRGGMGFGFRGNSPPWPYVGRGRGGLPRCAYFIGGGAPMTWPLPQSPYYAPPEYGAPFAPQMTREQELDYLKEKQG